MTPSTRAVQAATAAETEDAYILLLVFDHDDLAAPIRVCSGDVAEDELDGAPGIYSDGCFYAAFPFKINLPGQSGEEVSRCTLTIDNIDRRIVETLRAISSPPTLELSVVMLDTPDTLEAGPYRMTLREARYGLETVTAELAWEDILNEPFPGHCMTPADFPGLF